VALQVRGRAFAVSQIESIVNCNRANRVRSG